jgi:hypothetical protein
MDRPAPGVQAPDPGRAMTRYRNSRGRVVHFRLGGRFAAPMIMGWIATAHSVAASPPLLALSRGEAAPADIRAG